MAQLPWVVEGYGQTQVLSIPSIMTIQVDSVNAEYGDAIGVFTFDSNGVDVCLGAVLLSDSVAYLTVYGQENSGINLVPGEPLEFKLYDQTNQCEFINVTVMEDSGDVYFSPGDTTNVISVSAISSFISYPITESCQDDELVLYSNEAVSAVYEGVQGLVLDTVSGAVDVLQSQPGNHVIFFNTEICLLQDSVIVSIYAIPTIEINGDTISCEAENIELTINTDGDSVVWSNGDSTITTSFMSPNSGYVQVTNSSGCLALDSFELSVNTGFEIDDLQIQDIGSSCYDSTGLIFDLSNFPVSNYAIVLNSDTVGWTNSQFQTQVSSGDYEVKLVDEFGCTQSVDIIVTDETVNLDQIFLSISQPECGDVGEVQALYKNEELTLQIENYDPTSLQSGLYDLSIILDDECVIPWEEKIEIIEPIGCQSEVMYPGTDGTEATFYISNAGSTTIIDRNGQLVRSLQTPGHWDGRDDSNKLVPMGEYYIITNESSSITISVIR